MTEFDAKLFTEKIAPERRSCEWNHSLTSWWYNTSFIYSGNEFYRNYISPQEERFRDSDVCWECKIIFLIMLFEWQSRFLERT